MNLLNSRSYLLAPKALLLVVMLVGWAETPSLSKAQQNGDGSLYSRFGLGERYQFHNSMIQGMGGSATALTSLNYVNLNNPATWSDQSLARVVASVQFQGLQISNEEGNQSRLNSSTLQAFQFSFPLHAGKTGVVVSYRPFTRMAHKVQLSEEAVPDPTLSDPALYSVSFEGQGGLQQGTVGLGYRPSRYVSLGATFDFMFGIVRETRVTNFNTGDFVGTSLNHSTRMSGLTSTLGAHFSLPNLFGNDDALAIGFSLSLPTTLKGTQTSTIGESLNQDTLGVVSKGNLDLPTRASMGLAYYVNTRWIFVADYTIEPWSQFDGELPLAGFIPGESSVFDNRSRFSGGFSFQPSSNLLDSYFKRIGFRLGFYIDSGYLKLAENSDFETVAFTSGISLPTLFPGTRLDFNFEMGKRGKTDSNLVKENFYRFHLNVNIGERWFERRKLG